MTRLFVWRLWAFAIVGSIVIHGVGSIGLKLPKPGAIEKPAGPPVSVAGNLASILGAEQSEPVEVEATTTETRPVEAVESVKPPEVNPAETKAADATPVEPIETPEPPVPLKQATANAKEVPDVDAPDPLVARPATEAPIVATPAPAPIEVTTLAPKSSTPKEIQPTETRPEVLKPVGEAEPNDVSPKTQTEAQRRKRLDEQRKITEQERRKKERAAERRLEKAKRAKQRGEARRRSQAGSDRQGAAGTARGGKLGRSRASTGDMLSYGARVRARILSNRPASISSGRAVISFGVSTGGGLSYVRISRSSGNASFDRAALAAVRRSSPFPKPPTGASAGQLRFSIAFSSR